ncbi:MAG: hypothetical protein IJK22_07960 [Bacteroidales bacterium]|nr:hypothetical protein [Bacteroidales bacterium]
MKKAIVRTIEQSDKVGLYSICFDGNDLTEYEKFVQKFMDDATLNKDFQKVFRAIKGLLPTAHWNVIFDLKADMGIIWRPCRLTPRCYAYTVCASLTRY